MARVISVVNQKGGTGKTTSAVNIAACLALKGFRTLIVDMDPQANATIYLGKDPLSLEVSMFDALLKEAISINDITLEAGSENLFLTPAQVSLAKTDINLFDKPDKQYRLKAKLEAVKAKYDYIVIDCPPSLSLLPINALAASDEVLIPLQAQYLSLEGLKQLKDSIDKTKARLNASLRITGILFTMVDMRPKMTARNIDLVREHFGKEVFDAIIRICAKFNEAPLAGKTSLNMRQSQKEPKIIVK